MHDLILTEQEKTRAEEVIRQALHEDLSELGDITSNQLIPVTERGSVQIRTRQEGILAGIPFIPVVYELLGGGVDVQIERLDGSRLRPGDIVATLTGPVRTLLTGERTALNLLTLLSGNASLTARFVDAIQGTKARILDTRKTLPGLRLLQKYAVRCGGGTNHRVGLFDAVLIKDNHLGAWRANRHGTLADAVRQARHSVTLGTTVEIEVDTLEQFCDAIGGEPDIVLLDNMSLGEMREAVRVRDNFAPRILLEASGGVRLDTVTEIARTGVDRISVGALTHSAPALDLGFDWKQQMN